jgi:hypothetical protein
VGDDVIDYGCRREAIGRFAGTAERVVAEEGQSSLLPSASVSALICCGARRFGCSLLWLAGIAVSTTYAIRTSWLSAGTEGGRGQLAYPCTEASADYDAAGCSRYACKSKGEGFPYTVHALRCCAVCRNVNSLMLIWQESISREKWDAGFSEGGGDHRLRIPASLSRSQ